MLETEHETLLLRRTGGNPFRDPELEALVGHSIEGTDQLHSPLLIMDRWRPLD